MDPYKSFNFIIEIDGITHASFQGCSGLDSSTETEEIREGGVNSMVMVLPGKTTYSPIVLKRGITDSVEFYNWRQNVINGKIERKNGSIVLLSDGGEERMRWNFLNAWPAKWEGPAFDATEDAIALESLTLAHEGVEKG